MSTLVTSIPIAKKHTRVASSVRFTNTMLYVALVDGREIGIPLSQYPWLAQATPTQRERWHVEPHGFAVYWDDLDDGIEVVHLLE